jgi:hypothetical protein
VKRVTIAGTSYVVTARVAKLLEAVHGWREVSSVRRGDMNGMPNRPPTLRVTDGTSGVITLVVSGDGMKFTFYVSTSDTARTKASLKAYKLS